MNRQLRLWGHVITWCGVAMLAFAGLAYLDGYLASQRAIALFERVEAATPSPQTDEPFRPDISPPDQSHWSAGARRNYAKAVDSSVMPLAILTIDRLKLEVPVFLGTDPLTLNRGAGLIGGTARPGEVGNMAISAHRDGFFRALRNIAIGDVIRVRTPVASYAYRVTGTRIVDPLDVSVLKPTKERVLTLVTCYPFYYVGHAPERFIVRAVVENR